jgi:hypothetical protein
MQHIMLTGVVSCSLTNGIAFTCLQNKGYCKWDGKCRRFPVVIGETGSFLHDDQDRQWMQVCWPPAAAADVLAQAAL